jgi:hypothetical protein
MHYLYQITRKDGLRYIGVTNNLDRRLKEHYSGNGSRFLRGEVFTAEVLSSGAEADIYAAERVLVAESRPELNIAVGGSGGNTGGAKGEANGFACLSEDDVIIIRERVATNECKQHIADDFGISRQTVTDISSGKTWSHIGGPITKPKPAKRLGTELHDEIRRLRQEHGLSYNKIAKQLGISPATALKYGGG